MSAADTRCKENNIIHSAIVIINRKWFTLIFIGQYGKIYKANLQRSANDSIDVALKTTKTYSENETKNFKREMAMISKMMHPNIVSLYGIVHEGMSTICKEYILISVLLTTLLYYLGVQYASTQCHVNSHIIQVHMPLQLFWSFIIMVT